MFNHITSILSPAMLFAALLGTAFANAADSPVLPTYAYDAGMLRISASLGNGRVETRAYRTYNSCASICSPGVTDLTYAWDANKRKTRENDNLFPARSNVYDGYDDEDRLTRFSRPNGDSQAWTLSKAGDWNTFRDRGIAWEEVGGAA